MTPDCLAAKPLPGCASEAEGRRYVTRNYRTWPVCPLHGAELTVTRYGADPAKLECPKYPAWLSPWSITS